MTEGTTTAATPRWIEYLRLDDLAERLDEANPKGHDIDELRASLGRFGYTAPIELDERTGKLAAGHGRVTLLLLEHAGGEVALPEGLMADVDGMWLAPVVRGWSSENDVEAHAYLVTSNRLVERGGWIDAQLAALLAEAQHAPLGLAGTGYDVDDLERLAAKLDETTTVHEHERRLLERDDIDELPDVPTEVVTKRGDVWLLGPHRLMCGDCRDSDDVHALIGDARVTLAFTSPPYADRRTYDESSGFVPIAPDEYVEWFSAVSENVGRHLADDGSWFVNIKEHCENGSRVLYVKELTIEHVRAWRWLLVDELAWTKVGVPGTWPNRFKNAWEPVFHFARTTQIKFRPYANARESDDVIRHHPEAHFGFTRGGGMEYDGGERPTDSGPGLALPSNVVFMPPARGSSEHTAAFPVALPAWFVRSFTDEGDVVFDPFSGSGSTLLAAHDERRVGLGMELSPAYVDQTLVRWERLTGVVPLLAATGTPRSFLSD